MVPNHKLPTMLYALALVSETSLLGTGVIFALVVAISRKVYVNVDCHGSSWLLCVMPPSTLPRRPECMSAASLNMP